MALFPLFSEGHSRVAYRLATEALADESILVEELDESGSVPNLRVENKGDTRVLFLEGEELIGAKQNRILNTSVLIAAHSEVTIAVSCVEQGRWAYKSRYFTSSKSLSPSKLRCALKASVAQSLKQQYGHRSDQGKIWKAVTDLHKQHGVASHTSAMSDAFDAYSDTIDDYKSRLKYVTDAIGLAVAIGANVIALDVFDKPATCEKVWNRLVSGYVFDALEASQADTIASVSSVEQLLAKLAASSWEKVKAIGEGEDYRAESTNGDHASALVFDGTILHSSIVAAA